MIEEGQFWRRRGKPYYVVEIHKIIDRSEHFVRVNINIWYKSGTGNYYMISDDNTIKVHKNDFTLWTLVDIKGLK